MITQKTAKYVLRRMFETGLSAEKIIEAEHLEMKTDLKSYETALKKTNGNIGRALKDDMTLSPDILKRIKEGQNEYNHNQNFA